MPARRNVFLLYMPPRNLEAMLHYRETIETPVPLARIAPHISAKAQERLKAIFGARPIAVWGSRDGRGNRSQFEKMAEGDEILIVEGRQIKLLGKVAFKLVSPGLSQELWKPLDGRPAAGWDLIYFIANPVEIGVPFAKFCKLFGYGSYQLRGFTSVAEERLGAFYDRYDDLYSILVRMKDGKEVLEKPVAPILPQPAPAATEIEQADVEAVIASPIVSDHVKMQFKLAKLGLKAGEKVWVPAGDQEKLRRIYDFEAFEPRFAAGIDLPPSYVENIDVVWKEEFRIDAAFEVENTTAIYSGLLRFADLSIVAPNTLYPMFIVAPGQRRNQVRSQLLRPAFQRLKIKEKVLFLPYEEVDEIERFFERSDRGFSVEIIKARAEALG